MNAVYGAKERAKMMLESVVRNVFAGMQAPVSLLPEGAVQAWPCFHSHSTPILLLMPIHG